MISSKNSTFGPIFISDPILESTGYFWYFGSVFGSKIFVLRFLERKTLKSGPTLPLAAAHPWLQPLPPSLSTWWWGCCSQWWLQPVGVLQPGGIAAEWHTEAAYVSWYTEKPTEWHTESAYVLWYIEKPAEWHTESAYVLFWNLMWSSHHNRHQNCHWYPQYCHTTQYTSPEYLFIWDLQTLHFYFS